MVAVAAFLDAVEQPAALFLDGLSGVVVEPGSDDEQVEVRVEFEILLGVVGVEDVGPSHVALAGCAAVVVLVGTIFLLDTPRVIDGEESLDSKLTFEDRLERVNRSVEGSI